MGKVSTRLLIIILLMIVLTEIAVIMINWRNVFANPYLLYPNLFVVNSTRNFVFVVLIVRDAYAKVIVTITNPSNETLLVYLSNGTKTILSPGSAVKLTYLFTPTSYYASSCAGPILLPNDSSIPYLLNSLSNPIVIYESSVSIKPPSPYPILFNSTEALSTTLANALPCANGAYFVITTDGNNTSNVVITVNVNVLVFVI